MDHHSSSLHFTSLHFTPGGRRSLSWGFGSVGPFRGALGPIRGVLGPFKVVIRSAVVANFKAV